MVQWGKQLKQTAIPEWKNQYLDYKKLKKIVKELKICSNKLKSTNSRGQSSIMMEDILSPINIKSVVSEEEQEEEENANEDQEEEEEKELTNQSFSNKIIIGNDPDTVLFASTKFELDDEFNNLQFKKCNLNQFMPLIKSAVDEGTNFNQHDIKRENIGIKKKILIELQNEINKSFQIFILN